MKKYFLLFCAFECAFSSVVNPNFYYQDYLDFALNKGKFKVGAKDIQIVSKGGKIINFDVPMVDFSATNFSGRLKGEFTNIGQSFVVSAAHMTWGEKGSGANKGSLKQGDTLYFANIANKVVAASNDFRSRNAYDIDFAVFKMQKLNLNISANMSKEFDFIKQVSDKKEEVLRYTDVLDDSKDFSKGKGKLFDTSRYSYFVREGSGIQGLGDIDITIRPEIISTDDNYHIGGFVNLNEKDKQELIEGRKRFLLPIANFNGNLRNDFTSSSAPGDSGSALYVYDNVDKKWYLIGVISTSDCNTKFSAGYNCTLVNYALINQPLIEEFKKLKSIKLANGDYIFENNTLKQSDKNIEGVEFISQENSGYIVFGNGSSIYHFHDRIKEMEKSKDLYFSQSGSILLKSDTDLGAGVLNFTPNSHWKILGDKWFINGGIYTDIGSKVIYDAKLKEDDYLYKMGQGELEIRSNNKKSGLRMGEGLVSLIGEGEKFGEIYINGGVLKISNANNINFNTLYLNNGVLDLNGKSVSTNILKANSNNVFITSSKENANFIFLDTKDYIYHGNFVSDNNFKLDIKDSQMIFDGNIYNAKGIINISNSKVNFQGHPIIHAYIDKQSLTNLKKFGQDAFVKGEHIDQNNWENRIFSLKELNLNNTFFNLSSYAALEVQNLNAKNSNIVLGSNEINIDEKDTENIFHQNIGDSYGYDVLTGIGKEMFYEQNLKSIDKSHVKEVYFKGNLNLDNSDAFVYKTNFEGKINAFNNNKMVSLLHSKFKGKVSAKNLDLNENMIFGSIKALNLNALNNTFILDLDNRDRIISMESSDGGGNTILFDKIKNSDKNILLASLIDNKKKLNKQYFSFPSIQKGFSNYTPNIEFSRNGKELKWILTKVESENKPNLENSFFHTSDNKQALSTANSLVDHFILNYIAEWNNMQKRLGELRDNPYDYGVWLRNFGGKLSDKNSDGNYFEFQVGLDKQSEFSNSNFYSGFMLNFTQNKLNSNSLDVKSKGYGIGSYFSFLFDNNFYLDFVLRYVRYENDMSANFLPNVNSFLQSNASNNIITSLELGYRKYFNNFYFEPQIEFISGYVDNVHLFNDNVDIRLDSYKPLVLKSAFFVGANNLNKKLNFRTGLGFMSDLKKSGRKSFSDNVGTRYFDGLKDERAFVNFSTSYELNKNTRLNLEFEKSFFGDLNIDYSINANLRYSF